MIQDDMRIMEEILVEEILVEEISVEENLADITTQGETDATQDLETDTNMIEGMADKILVEIGAILAETSDSRTDMEGDRRNWRLFFESHCCLLILSIMTNKPLF